MKKYLSRAQELYRSVRYIRQQLGWRQAWQLVRDTGPVAAAPFPDTEQPLTVLVLSPHPDDESFGCGGALAFHARHSDRIHILYLHSGDGGNPDQATDTSLAGRREKEASTAAQILSAQATFWRIPDGTATNTPSRRRQLARLLQELSPERIYVPWPSDNHPDHIDAAELLAATLRGGTNRAEVWQYEVWSPLVPNRFLPIGPVREEKIKLMRAHASQLADRSYFEGILGLNSYRGLQAGLDGPAEAYCVLPAPTLDRSRFALI